MSRSGWSGIGVAFVMLVLCNCGGRSQLKSEDTGAGDGTGGSDNSGGSDGNTGGSDGSTGGSGGTGGNERSLLECAPRREADVGMYRVRSPTLLQCGDVLGDSELCERDRLHDHEVRDERDAALLRRVFQRQHRPDRDRRHRFAVRLHYVRVGLHPAVTRRGGSYEPQRAAVSVASTTREKNWRHALDLHIRAAIVSGLCACDCSCKKPPASSRRTGAAPSGVHASRSMGMATMSPVMRESAPPYD
jgi:hypothetical protein